MATKHELEIITTGRDNGASSLLSSLAGGLSNIATTAAGFLSANVISKITDGFMGLAREGFEAVSSAEMLQLQLESLVARELRNSGAAETMSEALTMSSERAQELIGWLKTLAKTSPFDSATVQAAFQQAMAYGLTSSEAQTLTEAMLNFGAATGKTSSEVGDLIFVLAQMQSTGTVTTQDLRQMMQRGVDLQTVAQRLGTTLEGLKNRTPQDVIAAIVDTMNEDFGTAVERASNTWSGFVGFLDDFKGMALQQILTKAFEGLKPVAESVTEILESERFSEFLDRIGESLAKFATNAGQVAVALLDWAINGGSVEELLAMMPEPIQGIVNAFQGMSDAIDSVRGMAEWFQPVIDLINGNGQLPDDNPLVKIWTRLQEIWIAVQPTLAQVGSVIQSVFGVIISTIAPTVNMLIEQIRQNWEKWLPSVDAAQAILTVLATVIGTVLTVVLSVVTGIVNGITMALAWFASFFETIQTSIERFVQSVAQFIGGIVDVISGIFSGDGELIAQGLQAMVEGWNGIVRNGLMMIVDVFTGALGLVLSFIGGFVQGVIDFFKNLFDKLVGHSIVPDMLMKMVTVFTSYLAAIVSMVGEWIANVIASIVSKVNEFLNAGQSLLQSLWDGLKTIWNNLWSWVGEIADDLIGKFTSINLRDIGQSIVSGLWDGISDMWNGFISDIQAKAQSLPDVVKKMLGIASPSRVFAEIGMNVMRGLAVGVEATAPVAQGAVTSAISGMTSYSTVSSQTFSTTRQVVFNIEHVHNASDLWEIKRALEDDKSRW